MARGLWGLSIRQPCWSLYFLVAFGFASISGCNCGWSPSPCPCSFLGLCYTECNGGCIEISTLDWDKNNCGDCGNVCPSDQVCQAGKCVRCSANETQCYGYCANLTSDFSNCGSCGNHCGCMPYWDPTRGLYLCEWLPCHDGVCEPCPPPRIWCKGRSGEPDNCVDPSTDPYFCGAHSSDGGADCSATNCFISGQSCVGGVCR